ncbi:MAG: acetyl-coenzyme A synthetase, partial [Thermoplasmata archaeon]|nr:acetyl-coenzyme A synthetase [Thermoplasmata archaeon]
PDDTTGYVVVERPGPGMLLTLRGDDERYGAAYWSRFPGRYYTGDFGLRDAEGRLWFLGRADEVLKVAGHRLGTIEIEDALLTVPGVAEAAVCGRADATKGEVPVAFVVLRSGAAPDAELAKALLSAVESSIGKIARPDQIVFMRSLPKTRSGKIMRRVVRAVVRGEADVGDVSTLEDESPVEEVRAALEGFRAQLGGAPP